MPAMGASRVAMILTPTSRASLAAARRTGVAAPATSLEGGLWTIPTASAHSRSCRPGAGCWWTAGPPCRVPARWSGHVRQYAGTGTGRRDGSGSAELAHRAGCRRAGDLGTSEIHALPDLQRRRRLGQDTAGAGTGAFAARGSFGQESARFMDHPWPGARARQAPPVFAARSTKRSMLRRNLFSFFAANAAAAVLVAGSASAQQPSDVDAVRAANAAFYVAPVSDRAREARNTAHFLD